MRGLTLMALALGLPGCSMPNPGFGVTGGAASSGAVDPSTSGATSAATDPVTGTIVSTSDASQTAAATSEAGTDTGTSTSTAQTSDPVMTSGSASSETGDPPQCPIINDALALEVAVNGQPIVECDEDGFYIEGILIIGSTLELVTDPNCGGVDPPTKISMGHGFPLVDAIYPGCVMVYGAWNHAAGGCQLGLLTVVPVDFPEAFVILASFSMPVPEMYPLQPKAILTDECGCPGDLPGCCPELDAGQLALEPTNDSGPVEQGNNTLITANNQEFDFYNLESWVGPECADTPGAGRNIDWIAVTAK